MKSNLIVITFLTISGGLFESAADLIHIASMGSNKFASDLAISSAADRQNIKLKKRIAASIGKHKGEIIAEFGKPSEIVSESAMVISGVESGTHAFISNSEEELRFHNPGYRFFLKHGRCIAAIDMTEKQGPTVYPR